MKIGDLVRVDFGKDRTYLGLIAAHVPPIEPLALDREWPIQYDFEVLVYTTAHGRGVVPVCKNEIVEILNERQEKEEEKQ
jgi:hypothetical protein